MRRGESGASARAFPGVPSGDRVNPRKRRTDGGLIDRPDQSRGFPTVMQEHQCRPELDTERTPERTPAAIGDLEMPHARMCGQRRCYQRLGATAVPARRTSELNQHRPVETINIGTRGFDWRILLIDCHGVILHALVSGAVDPRA